MTDDAPSAERWTVDGLELTPDGLVARLERPDGTTFTLPLSALPEGLHEGDLLAVQDGPDGVMTSLLKGQTQALQEKLQAELDALNTQGELPTNEQGEITL